MRARARRARRTGGGGGGGVAVEKGSGIGDRGSAGRSGAIWTVGHSNHSLERFIEILKAHDVERIIDVRRFPVSRKWPHFDAAALAASLPAAGIDSAGMPELGGRRKARPDSPHTAWRADAFRGYADFMDTEEFAPLLERAMALAREKRAALLCAEALPWRCHRSILADAFLARGWDVLEILNEKDARPRKLPAFARVEGTRVIYDGGQIPF